MRKYAEKNKLVLKIVSRIDESNCVTDRLVTPFIIYEHLPTRTKYVEFPFVMDKGYQRYRYYSDELPMKLKDFKKLRKGIKNNKKLEAKKTLKDDPLDFTDFFGMINDL